MKSTDNPAGSEYADYGVLVVKDNGDVHLSVEQLFPVGQVL
ncbi:hypothetical protein [Arthrobacter sp.]